MTILLHTESNSNYPKEAYTGYLFSIIRPRYTYHWLLIQVSFTVNTSSVYD